MLQTLQFGLILINTIGNCQGDEIHAFAAGDTQNMVPMQTEKKRPEHWIEQPGPSDVSRQSFAYLNYLRFVSMRCRAMPRTDLFEACALLHVSRTDTQQAYAEALMRCLHEALGKRPQLFAPGVTEVSFDERWLLQLGLASAREDDLSLRFLLTSRVAQEHRRLMSYLVRNMAEGFSLA